jgi:hypothetical protein
MPLQIKYRDATDWLWMVLDLVRRGRWQGLVCRNESVPEGAKWCGRRIDSQQLHFNLPPGAFLYPRRCTSTPPSTPPAICSRSFTSPDWHILTCFSLSLRSRKMYVSDHSRRWLRILTAPQERNFSPDANGAGYLLGLLRGDFQVQCPAQLP